MNQFNPTTGGHNLHNDEFVLMQSSYFDGFKAITYGISSTGNAILDGVRLSNNGTTLTFTYGHVAIGGEIFEVIAGTTPYFNSPVYVKILEVAPAVPPGKILYEDGTLKSVHIQRTAIITYDNSDGGVNYNDLTRASYHQIGDLQDWLLPQGKVLTDYFDNTGLGINQRYGWAICNGQNGTPDLRGFYRAQATAVPGNIALNSKIINPVTGTYFTSTIAQSAGGHSLPITKNNLPNYNLPSVSLSHSHNIQYSEYTQRGSTNSSFGALSGISPNMVTESSTTSHKIGISDSVTQTITVNSDGGNQALLNVPPTFYVYTLMKIY